MILPSGSAMAMPTGARSNTPRNRRSLEANRSRARAVASVSSRTSAPTQSWLAMTAMAMTKRMMSVAPSSPPLRTIWPPRENNARNIDAWTIRRRGPVGPSAVVGPSGAAAATAKAKAARVQPAMLTGLDPKLPRAAFQATPPSATAPASTAPANQGSSGRRG